MQSIRELKRHNRQIAQLCEVLSALVEHQSLRDNPYVCQLVSEFNEKVWSHLVVDDNELYDALLRHEDEHVRAIARRFRDSNRELKHEFGDYIRNWCDAERSAAEHASFVEQSRDIIATIRDQIRYENEQMLPLIESGEASTPAV